ncbi:MAG TPA: hypothetical protein VD996_11810 [Chitinophagaceae bacterium]|nr:hypothetical protein [Chitinophagaceae bacterium]
MGAIKHRKLGAATLLETIIAMVIILVVFFVVVTIVVQVSQSGGSVQKLRARQHIEWYAAQTLAAKGFFDERFKKDELLIERKVETFELNGSVMKVSFTVYDDNGKVIDKQHYLF